MVSWLNLIKLLLLIPVLILNIPSLIIVRILRDIPTIILGILLTVLITDIDLISALSLTTIIVVSLNIVLDWDLFFETVETALDTIAFGLYITYRNPVIKRGGYLKKDETWTVSRKITVTGKGYRVITFFKGLLPNKIFQKRQSRKKRLSNVTGYVVLDEKNLEEVRDREKIKEILFVYKIWYYFYAPPIGSKGPQDIFKQKRLLQNIKKLNRIFVQEIEKRKSNDYVQIKKKHSSEYLKILKQLDDQLILQSGYENLKADIRISIFDKLIKIFRHPSDTFYEDLLQKMDSLKELSLEENKVLNKRKNTFKKLANTLNLEIESLEGPRIKKFGRPLLIDLINYLYFSLPKFGATIIAFIVEIGRALLKIGGKYLVDEIIVHKFINKSITKNIEINRFLINESKKLSNILTETDIQLVRTTS